MSIVDTTKSAAQSLQKLGYSISGTKAARIITHYWIEPRLAGVTQELINAAIDSSAPKVQLINPNKSSALQPADILTMVLASYHAAGSLFAEKQGNLVIRSGPVDAWSKGRFTNDNKAEYEIQEKLLENFWSRFSLVNSIQPDSSKLGIFKGLGAKQTFKAMSVRDKQNPGKVYVVVPGANKDSETGLTDLKEGLDVMLGYTHDDRKDFADYLRHVESETGIRPEIVTYSNSSTMGYMAAAAGYKSHLYEPIGLRPCNVLDIMNDSKICFGVTQNAFDTVRNINFNSAVFHCGEHANIFGFAASHLTNSFAYRSGNKVLREEIENDSKTLGLPTSKAHQVAWMIMDVKSATGQWHGISDSACKLIDVLKHKPKLKTFEIG